MHSEKRDRILMKLEDMLSAVEPADAASFDKCTELFDNIAKPIGSLGKLETLYAKCAGASFTPVPDISKRCVLVFCADNGVLAQGVAQSTHEVTTAIARSMVRRTTSVCVMAESCGAEVFPIDIGMIDKVEGMTDRSVGRGTGDMSRGPAMTRQQALDAVSAGFELVHEKKREGYGLIAVGEAGIGNTTTSAAVAAVLLGLRAEDAAGRGSGLSDEGLRRKIKAINTAIEVNRPDKNDILDVLSKIGGFDIAGMCGAFLGGAACRMPVIMDGLISSVAALCAVRLCPAVKGYIIPSHVTAEPAGVKILAERDFDPMLHGDMRLGEGTGAVALMPLLDMAGAVLKNAATFGKIEVEKYRKWN